MPDSGFAVIIMTGVTTLGLVLIYQYMQSWKASRLSEVVDGQNYQGWLMGNTINHP